MGEIKRNAEVVQALNDIPGETGGVALDLDDCQHFHADPGTAAGHDQPDISGTEDHRPAPRDVAVDVDQPLSQAGSKYPGGAGAGDTDVAAISLPAAHGQHDGPGVDLGHAAEFRVAVHRVHRSGAHLQSRGL